MKSFLARVPRSIWIAIVVTLFGLGIIEKFALWFSRLNDRDGYAGTAMMYPGAALYGIGFAMFFGGLGYLALRGIAAAVEHYWPRGDAAWRKSSTMSRLALVGALVTVVGVALCTVISVLMEDSIFDISTSMIIALMVSIAVTCIGALAAAIGVLGLIGRWIRVRVSSKKRPSSS